MFLNCINSCQSKRMVFIEQILFWLLLAAFVPSANSRGLGTGVVKASSTPPCRIQLARVAFEEKLESLKRLERNTYWTEEQSAQEVEEKIE